MAISYVIMLLMFISKTKEKLISDACGIEKWRHLFVKVICESFKSTISPFTWSLGGAKNFACRLAGFQSGSLMNELKCQIGVA